MVNSNDPAAALVHGSVDGFSIFLYCSLGSLFNTSNQREGVCDLPMVN